MKRKEIKDLPWNVRCDTIKTMVYVVQAETTTRIKIGYCHPARLDKRMGQLQVGCPFKIIVVLVLYNGTRKLEKQLHKDFQAERVIGEWFQLSPRIERFIEQNIKDPIKVLTKFSGSLCNYITSLERESTLQ